MKGMYQLGQERTGRLRQALEVCFDAKEAQDAAAKWLDDIAAAWCSQAAEPGKRAKALDMTELAKAALACVGAVSRTSLTAGPSHQLPRPKGVKSYLHFLPGVMCGAGALAAIFLDQGMLAVWFLLCAGAALVLAIRRERGNGEAQLHLRGTPQADPEQMIRRLCRLLKEMDARLEMAQEGKDGPEPLPMSLLEAVQMLMEAQLTQDAEYALKGIPLLADALAGQGVEFIAYVPGREGEFDLLPAPTGGQTIRPALRQGEKLLLRGQATVEK